MKKMAKRAQIKVPNRSESNNLFFSPCDKMLKLFFVDKKAEMHKSPIETRKLIQISRKIDRISNVVNEQPIYRKKLGNKSQA